MFDPACYFGWSMVQVFTLIAMEPPIRVSGAGSADYVRDAKVTNKQTNKQINK